jgi:hypothetical protein
MEKIIDFVIKALVILGGVGLIFGTFFIFELLFRSHVCH